MQTDEEVVYGSVMWFALFSKMAEREIRPGACTRGGAILKTKVL